MNTEEMIDRYIHAVGEHLPRNARTDIERELRSLVQDALDEQQTSRGEEIMPQTVAIVLRSFGAPTEIAARYRRSEVLIGAVLFPIYRTVLLIILAVIGGIHLVGLLFFLIQTGAASVAENLLTLAGSFWEVALLNAGIVTLIFAIIERAGGDWVDSIARSSQKPGAWDPYQLPPVKDPDRIQRGELMAGIVVSLFFIVGFNFFFDSIGIIDLSGESQRIIGLLAPELRQQVVWLTASWALDSLLKLVVLVQGRWNRVTRWLEAGTVVFSLYVLSRIFVSDAITIWPVFTLGARLIVGLLIALVLLDLLRKLYRLLFGRPFFTGRRLTRLV